MLDEKTRPIAQILKRVVASAYLRNSETYPLSALLVAPVGAGKTTLIKKACWGNGVLGLSDCTPYGLAKLLPEIEAKGVKHIVIYDMVEPMSRSRVIVNPLIGFLNSLIEEGIFRVSTGFITIDKPIKLGLITSTTKKELFDKRRGWLSIGFISRMLPISWTFTDTDVIQILQALASGGLEGVNPEEIKLRARKVEGDPTIFQKLIPYAQAIEASANRYLTRGKEGELIEVKVEAYPFRRQKQLMIFLMSNALLRGSPKVEEKDFEEFQALVRWMNYDLNPL